MEPSDWVENPFENRLRWHPLTIVMIGIYPWITLVLVLAVPGDVPLYATTTVLLVFLGLSAPFFQISTVKSVAFGDSIMHYRLPYRRFRSIRSKEIGSVQIKRDPTPLVRDVYYIQVTLVDGGVIVLSSFWADYVRWLSDELQRRGVPVRGVP